MSDYFGAMFTSNVREAKQEEVKMEGVDPDALWALVQYAYTGRLWAFMQYPYTSRVWALMQYPYTSRFCALLQYTYTSRLGALM